jgi:hypothetical protein
VWTRASFFAGGVVVGICVAAALFFGLRPPREFRILIRNLDLGETYHLPGAKRPPAGLVHAGTLIEVVRKQDGVYWVAVPTILDQTTIETVSTLTDVANR